MSKKSPKDRAVSSAVAIGGDATNAVLGQDKKKKKRKLGKKERLEKRRAKEVAAKSSVKAGANVAKPRASRAVVSRKPELGKNEFAQTPVRWFTHEKAKRQKPLSKGVKQADEDTIESAKQETQLLLRQLVEDVEREQKQRNSHEDQWLKKVRLKGTLSDRVAALTLLIQEAPLYRLDSLKRLLNMATKKGSREAVLATEALRDMFVNDLLPPDRRLRFFEQQPFPQDSSLRPEAETLLYWLLEDHIKILYGEFVMHLDSMSRDTRCLAHIKKSLVTTLAALLTARPEREQELLTALTNKLGDPDKKVSSKVVYLLTETIRRHPGMRMPCCKEVERLLLRANVTERSQYYAILFLNQIIFARQSHADTHLANFLIKLYLGVFKQHEQRSRKNSNFEAKTKNKGTEVTPDMSSKAKCSLGERFSHKSPSKKLGAMNSKLLAGVLTGVNRAFPYAQLPPSFFENEIDVLFRTVHSASFGTALQALMVLFHVTNTSTASSFSTSLSAADKATSRFHRALYEKLLAPELGSSNKQSLFLNLLYRSLKAKSMDDETSAAFVKRLLQVCSQWAPSFVCGTLFLLSEVSRARPILRTMLASPQSSLSSFSALSSTTTSNTSQVFTEADLEGNNEYDEDTAPDSQAYQPENRNPKFANATGVCAWELALLTSHFHPSVQAWSRFLLDGSPIKYNGHPLKDFTTAKFLEKLVFKNPKKLVGRKAQAGFNRLSSSSRAPLVNSAAFLRTPAEQVEPDARFFHKYFSEKARRDAKDPAKQSAKKLKKQLALEADEDSDDFADKIMEEELRKQAMGLDVLDDDDLSDFSMSGDGEGEFEGDFGEDSEVEMNFSDSDGGASPGIEIGKHPDYDSSDDDESQYSLSTDRIRKTKREKEESAFADAEDFASILEEGQSEIGSKLERWQKTAEISARNAGAGSKTKYGRGKRRKR